MCNTQRYTSLLFNKNVTSFGGFNSGYPIGLRDLNPSHSVRRTHTSYSKSDFIRRLTDHFNLIIWQLTLHHFYNTAINNFDKDNELLDIVLLYAIGHRARTLDLYLDLAHSVFFTLALSVCQPEHKGQKHKWLQFNVAMTFSIGFYFRVAVIVTIITNWHNAIEAIELDQGLKIRQRLISHSLNEWLEMKWKKKKHKSSFEVRKTIFFFGTNNNLFSLLCHFGHKYVYMFGLFCYSLIWKIDGRATNTEKFNKSNAHASESAA